MPYPYTQTPKKFSLTSPLPIAWLLGGLLLIVMLLRGSFLEDGDTGVHIRAGQLMLQTHQFICLDPFSYFTPAVQWNNHEWLSQILMALAYQIAGLKSVIIFYALLITTTHILLFKQMEEKANTKLALVLFPFVIANSYIHWHARPHLFTLFFIVIWHKILDDFQTGKRNRLFWMPLLMLVWVNLHGGFLMGILLLAIYGFGNLLNAWWKNQMGSDPTRGLTPSASRKFRSLAIISIMTGLITLLNPDGLHLWKYIFRLTSNKLLMDNIMEFMSVDFHTFFPALHLIYISLLIFALSRKPISFIEWMLVGVFGFMSLYSRRHITLYTMLVSPILAAQLYSLWQVFYPKLLERFPDKAFLRPTKETDLSPGKICVFNILYIVIFLLGAGFVLSPLKTYAFDPSEKPVQAVEFFQKEKLPGQFLSTDEFGDYIIYKLWPERKVFVYGFNDKEGLERFKDYYTIIILRSKWREVLEKHHINWIVCETNASFASVLNEHPDWKLIYSDKAASIFIRNLPENQPWIQKFLKVKFAAEDPFKEK